MTTCPSPRQQALYIYVAVPGWSFHCIFQLCYYIQSAVAQERLRAELIHTGLMDEYSLHSIYKAPLNESSVLQRFERSQNMQNNVWFLPRAATYRLE